MFLPPLSRVDSGLASGEGLTLSESTPRTGEFRNERVAQSKFPKEEDMTSKQELKPNTFYIEVSGAGIPEVDGLFVPSTAPPAESESGTMSSIGYWNGKMAWDRADG